MGELFAFVKSVWSHWKSGMSGSIGLLLTAMGFSDQVEGSTVNKLFWIAGAAFTFVAFFLAWRQEYRARIAAEKSTYDKPRRLDATQSDRIVQALRASRGHIDILNDLSAHDASKLAGDLRSAFQRAGWTVRRSHLFAVRVPPPSGVAVELPETSDPHPDP
jgi:hypothetical protein